MLPAVRATGGPGEAVDYDPAAGPAGRWPAGTAALAQTTLVLPNVRLPAQVVHRARRPSPGSIPAHHPVAAGGRGGGRRRRPHDRAGRPRPRHLLAGRRRRVRRPRGQGAAGRAGTGHGAGHRRGPAGQAALGLRRAGWLVDHHRRPVARWLLRLVRRTFCDLSGGQGLLAQVEGRTTATVTGWLAARRPGTTKSEPSRSTCAPSSRPPSGMCCHTRCWWSTTSMSCNWPTGPLPRSAVGPCPLIQPGPPRPGD